MSPDVVQNLRAFQSSTLNDSVKREAERVGKQIHDQGHAPRIGYYSEICSRIRAGYHFRSGRNRCWISSARFQCRKSSLSAGENAGALATGQAPPGFHRPSVSVRSRRCFSRNPKQKPHRLRKHKQAQSCRHSLAVDLRCRSTSSLVKLSGPLALPAMGALEQAHQGPARSPRRCRQSCPDGTWYGIRSRDACCY